jgi:hypothetical protein
MSLVWGGISRRTGVTAYFRPAVPGVDVIVAGARLLCGVVVARDSGLIANARYAQTGHWSRL